MPDQDLVFHVGRIGGRLWSPDAKCDDVGWSDDISYVKSMLMDLEVRIGWLLLQQLWVTELWLRWVWTVCHGALNYLCILSFPCSSDLQIVGLSKRGKTPLSHSVVQGCWVPRWQQNLVPIRAIKVICKLVYEFYYGIMIWKREKILWDVKLWTIFRRWNNIMVINSLMLLMGVQWVLHIPVILVFHLRTEALF